MKRSGKAFREAYETNRGKNSSRNYPVFTTKLKKRYIFESAKLLVSQRRRNRYLIAQSKYSSQIPSRYGSKVHTTLLFKDRECNFDFNSEPYAMNCTIKVLSSYSTFLPCALLCCLLDREISRSSVFHLGDPNALDTKSNLRNLI